jgi:ABC-type uncharacterized transport system permease subunit
LSRVLTSIKVAVLAYANKIADYSRKRREVVTQKFSPMQIGIIILTLITAIIHLVPLGIAFGDVLFILNGLGYLGLLGAIFLPLDFLDGYRSYAKWALLVYAIITIVAYFVVNPEAWSSPFGLITKAVEVVLVILLFMDSRQ